METKNEISVELSALSEPVSKIGRLSPYGVPPGYFDRFPALVLARITARSSTFQVPKGYFDDFAGSVLARIKSESVDDELARLSVTVSRIGRRTPYEAPGGYFEELSPVLSVLRDRSTYQAPAGYFTELAPAMMETVAQPAATAKIIPMEHRELSVHSEPLHGTGGKVLKGHWWKFSSAAAVAACLLLIFSWPQVGNQAGSGGLNMADLRNVSDNEIQTYLDDEHSILAEPVSTSTATLDLNEGDVKNLLGEVSDDDLQQYMEEHGKADDMATN